MANPENKYYRGQWLFYCDVCGKKMLSNDAKRRWDGLYVCKADWEARHPSDFIRARKETSNQLPWSRPVLPEADVSPIFRDEYIRVTDGLASEDEPFYIYYVYDTTNTTVFTAYQYAVDGYMVVMPISVDTAYAGTGVFYWYDTVNNISSTPEAYVTGDYL